MFYIGFLYAHNITCLYWCPVGTFKLSNTNKINKNDECSENENVDDPDCNPYCSSKNIMVVLIIVYSILDKKVFIIEN